MNAPSNRDSDKNVEQGLADVVSALERLRYGSITVTVHDGRVVQIDVTEKRRLGQ